MSEDFDELLTHRTTLKIGDRNVVLDPSRLIFNEANLSTYIEREAIYYDNLGNILAEAEAVLADIETDYDSNYAQKFALKKEEGGSDKLVESIVKADPAIVALKKSAVAAKKNVRIMQQHLRAWDKCHENAQSRGHTLRKELDKLGGDIYKPDRERTNYSAAPAYAGDDVDSAVANAIGSQD